MASIIKISAESLNDFRKDSAQFAHDSDLFRDESESQNDTPRRYVVAVSTNDRRPASRIFSTMEAAEKVYNNLKKHFSRFGYTLADSGGTDATHGLCELWTKYNINRNIEIYPIL